MRDDIYYRVFAFGF